MNNTPFHGYEPNEKDSYWPDYIDSMYNPQMDCSLDQAYATYTCNSAESALCASDLELSFFDSPSTHYYPSPVGSSFTDSPYPTHYYPSPAGSSFSSSPPSTGKSSGSLLSVPLSPSDNGSFDSTTFSFRQPRSPIFPSSTTYYDQLLDLNSFPPQHFPPQRSQTEIYYPPSPTASPSKSNMHLAVQVDNGLGLRMNFTDPLPQWGDATDSDCSSPKSESSQRSTPHKRAPPGSGRNRISKKPYSPRRPNPTIISDHIADGAIPHPVNTLPKEHSFEEGMYLFNREEKDKKHVDGFCYLPLEAYDTVEKFLDTFRSNSKKSYVVGPQWYCMSGELLTCSDGNEVRGKLNRKEKSDNRNCHKCELCGRDFTTPANAHYHIAGHFNLKPIAVPCGMLFANNNDAKRHCKTCQSCRDCENDPVPYSVPFHELRYTILENARRDRSKGWIFPESSIQRGRHCST